MAIKKRFPSIKRDEILDGYYNKAPHFVKEGHEGYIRKIYEDRKRLGLEK